MKLKSVAFSSGLFAFCLGMSVLSSPVFASGNCTLGVACPLTEGESSSFAITPEDGTDFTCVVTASNATITFLVKGTGRYKIITGGGQFVADPFVSLNIHGKFGKTAIIKGRLMFADVTGGNGLVVCHP